MFTYPLADNLFINFFAIINQLISAKTLEELIVIKKRIDGYLDSYHLIVEASSAAMKRGAEDHPSTLQVELIATEYRLITALCYIYECQLKEYKGANYQIDAVIYNTAREIIELIKAKKLPTSAFARSYYYYIAYIIFVYDSTHYDANDKYSLLGIISSTSHMIEYILPLAYALPAGEEMIDNLSDEQLRSIREGYQIAISDKKRADDSVETCLLTLTKKRVDLLMAVRKQKVAQLHAGQRRHLEDQILQIDALLKFLNLSAYPEYRKLYQQQLRRHRLHKNYVKDEIYLFENRITVLSGLIDLDNMFADITIASVLISRYLSFSENIFDVLTYLKKSGYDTERMLAVFIYHIRLLKFDVRMLATLASYATKTHVGAGVIFTKLNTQLSLTLALLYKFDADDAKLYENALDQSILHDFRYQDLNSRAMVSLYSIYYQVKFAIKLVNCHSDQSRLTEFKNVASVFRAFADAAEQHKEDSVHVYHYCLEYYLTALSLCKDHDELSILLQNTLQRDIFALRTHENNKETYQFLFMLLSFHKSPDYIHLPMDQSLVDEMDFPLVERLFHTCKHSIMQLLNNPHRVGGELGSFFLLNAKAVLTRMLNDPQSNVADLVDAKNALSALNKFTKTVYIRAMKLMERTSQDNLTYKPVCLGETRDLVAIKQSFLPETKLQAGTPAIAKQHKTAKKTSSLSGQEDYYPHVSHPIARLKEYFNHDYQKLYQFYQRKLGNRKIDVACYALLGCAHTLYLLDDEKNAKTLAKQLNTASSSIFNSTLASLYKEKFQQYQAEFMRLLKPWLDKPQPPAIAVVQEIATAFVEPKRKGKSYTTNTAAPQYAAQRYRFYGEPRPLNKLLAPKLSTEEFHGLRVYRTLPINITPQQQAIIDLLSHEQMRPMVHGGTVIDSIFGVPPRDLDLLCFADQDTLMAQLLENKAKYGIINVRANAHAPVIVIEFDKQDIKRCHDEQLEILVLPKDKNKSYQITQLAMSYGLAFFIYDLANRNIIDPLNLYDELVTKHIFQVSDYDIDAYFQKNPARILDCLYRVAKYKHYGINLTLCDALDAAIPKSIQRIDKLPFSMFDKIFMQGFATDFIAVLKPFADITLLFPSLHPAFAGVSDMVCRNHDAILKKALANIDQRKFEYLRALLLTNLLYDSFINDHNISHYQTNARDFYIDCARFLNTTKFETSFDSNCGSLVNTIQDMWLKKIKSPLDFSGPREESKPRVAL